MVRPLLVMAVLSLAPALSAQSPQSPLTGLDALIQDAMTKAKAVGLAIAIVKNDSIVYAKGFGVKKVGDPAPVTPRTLFAVGSTTKAFTTAALGMLVDEGRLSWDDKVTDRLSGFQLYDPAVTREVTVRDLVTHRSGLSRGDRLWMGSNLSRAEVIRRVRFHQPSTGFRTTFGYQNIMYLSAGEIIPALTGKSWDDFLKERIFTPLGMTSTSTTVRALRDQPDVAEPHDPRDGAPTAVAYREMDNVGPAGSINSNVLDMAQWIRLHLNGGMAGGRMLLKPETVRELFTPQTLGGPGPPDPEVHFRAYGLGWFLSDRAGRKIIEHSGWIDGMVTQLIMVPEERLGVITLGNYTGAPVGFPIAQVVIDRYLGISKDRMTPFLAQLAAIPGRQRTVQDSVEKARAKDTRPSLPLEAYTGAYDNPMYGPAKIGLDGGKLVLAIRALRDSLRLEHWQYDVFRGTWGDAQFGKSFVTFRLAANGPVAGVTIDGIEQEFVRRSASVALLACEPSDVDRVRLATRLSPYDSAAVRIGSREARVCYSRPAMRGRAIFGTDLVPYDTLWRTGANDPTTIHLPFAAEIAGIALQPGSYSINTVPARGAWKIVLNGPTARGMHEVGRASVPAEALAEPVERFTIRSESTSADRAELILEWEKTRVRVPVRALGGKLEE